MLDTLLAELHAAPGTLLIGGIGSSHFGHHPQFMGTSFRSALQDAQNVYFASPSAAKQPAEVKSVR